MTGMYRSLSRTYRTVASRRDTHSSASAMVWIDCTSACSHMSRNLLIPAFARVEARAGGWLAIPSFRLAFWLLASPCLICLPTALSDRRLPRPGSCCPRQRPGIADGCGGASGVLELPSIGGGDGPCADAGGNTAMTVMVGVAACFLAPAGPPSLPLRFPETSLAPLACLFSAFAARRVTHWELKQCARAEVFRPVHCLHCTVGSAHAASLARRLSRTPLSRIATQTLLRHAHWGSKSPLHCGHGEAMPGSKGVNSSGSPTPEPAAAAACS
mmetsp:Transcript_81167/g.131499  ORF Transcript_81167/g.131499 Transcript_81167/m.131499 type:complete len:271 (+) Transcript_81167:680-1492(+)